MDKIVQYASESYDNDINLHQAIDIEAELLENKNLKEYYNFCICDFNRISSSIQRTIKRISKNAFN